MGKLSLVCFACITCLVGFSQKANSDSLLRVRKDSTFRATMHADSLKIEKQFAEIARWDGIKARVEYPVIKAGDFSGIIPVKNITEIPDPNMEYKLLFELVSANPDSVAREMNYGLVEISRVINLHVAAGIPVKKIIPVIVVHAGALHSIITNESYKEHYKLDNPNLKLINDLKNVGARFIACGQAMTFFNVKREELLPDVKVSLTAQTVLSSYQLKGYVLYDMSVDNK